MDTRKLFILPLVAIAAMFAYAPYAIHAAPYESTMGLVQKIFYFHVPAAMAMFLSAFVCGIASAVFLFGRKEKADRLALSAAELTVLFGLIVLISGPLWARKAWGVWWQWDARLTSTLILWLVFQAYLLLRRYGGPGSDRLAAGVAIFGAANVPFVYWSVNVWRTLHPPTNVVRTLEPEMMWPFMWSAIAYLGLYGLMLAARYRLENRRAELEEIYLAAED
ncbi:MAG: cytochrome c biogenesis protein CcsA [Acidobacteria bacterium]|nr:cytochrome c biogenesis protein CcsA [Acidobacteriota bacterium]MBA3884716.1 cytochrome c biogenesis protein CcsA [Acidobacteriota bacterium]